ncbi:UPF0481 protein At3g47200-like [Zingiber officinale]|uniref:UPF0481 protein At3g47200-like n=1 Tax=Zingiber officinale TaxID=94328 RepID=UPI001C4AFA8C|nr:UPF0481 protein At3g47200-like [Zingiber officinale]
MKNKDSTFVINIDEEWIRKLENIANYEAKRQFTDQDSTIFRVSEILRAAQPEAYEPMLVSLGPYHHHKPHLQARNQLKWLLLNKLLEKSPKKGLRDYLILIKEKEIQVRNTYSVQPINMCEETFIEMMLLDCVFVIMILWFWKEDQNGLKAIENPVFMSGQRSWIVVARDMLLLENQLPFFLLETLFDSAFPNKHGRLKQWMVQFFSGFVNDKIQEAPKGTNTIHHILHLFYLCIVSLNKSSIVVAPQSTVFERLQNDDNHHWLTPRLGWIPSATRLAETGIKMKRKQKATSFLDITFNKGVLEIPPLEIDDDTNILFRNLIAFEQCQKDASGNGNISAYASFMSCIIDTAADVELLQEKAIIINGFGNKKKVANLFSKLCKEVVIDHENCYISGIFKGVNEHNIHKWNTWCADLNPKYFPNPSLCTSFIVILLFIIAIMQFALLFS